MLKRSVIFTCVILVASAVSYSAMALEETLDVDLILELNETDNDAEIVMEFNSDEAENGNLTVAESSFMTAL